MQSYSLRASLWNFLEVSLQTWEFIEKFWILLLESAGTIFLDLCEILLFHAECNGQNVCSCHLCILNGDVRGILLRYNHGY